MKSSPFKKTYSIFISILILFTLPLFSYGTSPSLAQVHREQFVKESLKYVGFPYVYGATGPNSFDCSGFVYYCAKQALDKNLPRTSREQYDYCTIIDEKDREVGDLVFFKTNYSRNINHVGIYIGNNKFISALSEGKTPGVNITDLGKSYWKKAYFATGKFLPTGVRKSDDSYNYGSDEGFFYPDEESFYNPFSDDEDVTYVGDEVEEYREKRNNQKNHTDTDTLKEYMKKEDVKKLPKQANPLPSISCDISGFVDWSIFKPKMTYQPYEKDPNVLSHDLHLSFRGVNVMAQINFPFIFLNPGFGFGLRYNHGVGVFQIPLILSITPNEILRFYMGPCFSFGNAKVPEVNIPLQKNVYQIMMGMTISTPILKMGNVGVQLIQDISYTDFSKGESFTLSYPKNIYTGFMFSTGLRITL